MKIVGLEEVIEETISVLLDRKFRELGALLNEESARTVGWLPAAEAAKVLGAEPKTLRNWAKKYGLETSSIGGKKFYSLKSINELLENNKARP